MPHTRRRSRLVPAALAAFVLVAATPAREGEAVLLPPGVQQAGHGTLPTTGAAAPGGFATTEREADPVLAGIEELRRLLADTGRKYKKARDSQKAEAQRELLEAFARARAELLAAHELLTPR